jgi:hypothetical protein
MDNPRRREPLEAVCVQLAEAIRVLRDTREEVVAGEAREADDTDRTTKDPERT